MAHVNKSLTHSDLKSGITFEYKNRQTKIFVDFNEETSMYAKNDNEYNIEFVCMQLSYIQSMLKIQGYVFVNDVLDAIGMKKTPMGQIDGWFDGGFSFEIDIDSSVHHVILTLKNVSTMYHYI